MAMPKAENLQKKGRRGVVRFSLCLSLSLAVGHFSHLWRAVLAGRDELRLVRVVVVGRAPEVNELEPRARRNPHLLLAHLLHREGVGHQQHVLRL
jgi:hypothetical protein